MCESNYSNQLDDIENQVTIGMHRIRAWVKNHLQCLIWDVPTHPFSGLNGGVTIKPLQNSMSRVRLMNFLLSANVYFEKKITKFSSWVSSWWRVIIDWGMPETYGEKKIGKEIVCRSPSLSLQWRSMSFIAFRWLFVQQLVQA